MNIVYAANDNYAGYLGISMYSLFENNKKCEEINVYIMSNNICESNKVKFQNMANEYKRNIEIIELEDIENILGFKVDLCGFNITILSRLFLENILKNIDKVLYFDCDIIITQNIENLYNTDISNYYCAGVSEFLLSNRYKKEIGLKENSLYINSGVLLVNLSNWRKDNLQIKFVNYLKKMNGKIRFADQDIINYCCQGKIKEISYKYNYQPNLKYFSDNAIKKIQPHYTLFNENNKDISNNPIIIHYLGDERPWVKGNHNPYRKIWNYYKNRSLWKDQKMINGHYIYMQIYFILNLVTKICPYFRVWFFNHIGINKFKWFGKK